MAGSSKSECTRGWSVNFANLVTKKPLGSYLRVPGQPHAGISIQGNNKYPRVDLPPMSSRPISILQLTHRSDGTCEIRATIKLMCGAEGRNDVRGLCVHLASKRLWGGWCYTQCSRVHIVSRNSEKGDSCTKRHEERLLGETASTQDGGPSDRVLDFPTKLAAYPLSGFCVTEAD